MKKIYIVLSLSLVALLGCSQEQSNNTETINKGDVYAEIKSDTAFNFENSKLNKLPVAWSQYFTGKKGENPNWQIIDDNGNKVLAQLTTDNPNYHFNDIVFDNIIVANVELEVKLKGANGRMDRGGGFIWRFVDADNYYVVRANPLEDNVVLYKVKNGHRSDLALVGKGKTYGVDVDKLGSGWNTLKLIVYNDIFTVYLNNKEIFKVKDETFKNAGKVGLWTKADAVTYFDDFKIISK